MSVYLDEMKELCARFKRQRFEDGDGRSLNQFFPPSANAVEIFAEHKDLANLFHAVRSLRQASRYMMALDYTPYDKRLLIIINWIEATRWFDISIENTLSYETLNAEELKEISEVFAWYARSIRPEEGLKYVPAMVCNRFWPPVFNWLLYQKHEEIAKSINECEIQELRSASTFEDSQRGCSNLIRRLKKLYRLVVTNGEQVNSELTDLEMSDVIEDVMGVRPDDPLGNEGDDSLLLAHGWPIDQDCVPSSMAIPSPCDLTEDELVCENAGREIFLDVGDDPQPPTEADDSEAAPEQQVEGKVQYVTLDQMAARVNRSKRTLRRAYEALKLPEPDCHGGGGKSHEWKWATVKPILEHLYARQLPDDHPSSPCHSAE